MSDIPAPWHFRLTATLLFLLCFLWAGYVFFFHAWRMLNDPDRYEAQYERWHKENERRNKFESLEAHRDVLNKKLAEVEASLKKEHAAAERRKARRAEAEREQAERERVEREEAVRVELAETESRSSG